MSLYDVTGIGNAIVDVLCPCDDQFLIDYGIEKGSMTLIDEARAKELYAAMDGKATEKSGGSAANTMAGIVSFGGKGAYIGLVANDALGNIFTNDIADSGVKFETAPYIKGLETARSFIFITPDSERSMNTFLGACTELSIEHVNSFMISNSDVTYMEGYLFDKDPAKEAFYKSAQIAKDAGKKVSLSLSDSFCVDRHRDDFMDLIKGNIDILFCNEPEIMAMFETDDFDYAFNEASKLCETVVATRSAKGIMIASPDGILPVAAEQNVNVVDLTGAGDQLAAGFLYGYTNGYDAMISGKLGVMAAAEAISHIGPRPQIDYSEFLDDV